MLSTLIIHFHVVFSVIFTMVNSPLPLTPPPTFNPPGAGSTNCPSDEERSRSG